MWYVQCIHTHDLQCDRMTRANAHAVRFPEGTALEVSARLIDIALFTRCDAAPAVVKHAQRAAAAHVLTEVGETTSTPSQAKTITLWWVHPNPPRRSPAIPCLTLFGIASSPTTRLQKGNRCLKVIECS